jgi:hypothetical protein
MSNIEIVEAALQKGGRRLFHFTDSRNIESIRQHGLLPTNEVVGRGIQAITGGDEASLSIDRLRGFDGYVRLSFCRQHPMAHVAIERGNIEVRRILSIDPSVLLREGVLIADRIATANDARILPANDLIHEMDFEATYKFLDWSIPENHARRNAAEKWEALIPNAILPNLIRGL